LRVEDLKEIPVEVGLQSDSSYPHHGKLDYVAPTVDQSTGTLAARAILQNDDGLLLPGYFVRVRIPRGEANKALLVPDVALGSDQGGRYVLVVNKDNVVEQKRIKTGQLLVGGLRVITEGLAADDRVVLTTNGQAVPGGKVVPKLETIPPPPPSANITTTK
jgi:RND family efflux transporter MFP subunit